MAEVVRYVDPDASGAGNGTSWTDAYTSLSAWNTGEATNLVTAGDWHHVYCRSSAGSADTTAVAISGWTTDADHYILIEAADGDEAVKTGWDTSRYRLHTTDQGPLITIYENFVRLKNLQIRMDNSSNNFLNIVDIQGLSSGESYIRIDGCRIESNGAGYYAGISIEDSDATVTIQDTIIYNVHRYGIRITVNATVNIYQCVISDIQYTGGIVISAPGATVKVTNSAIFDTANDISDAGSATIDHCASDDGDGTNSVSPSGSDWDNEFTDPDNGDFTLLNTGNCFLGGTTISGGPTYDIDGDAWDASTPSIGADEYAAAGGTTLTLANAAHSHTIGGVVLEQVHYLSTSSLAHSHTLDGVSLTASVLLAIADLAHSQSLDGVALTGTHNIAVGDLAHSQSLDAVLLSQLHNLVVDDLEHTQSLDSVTVTLKGALVVSDLSHGHTLGGVNLTQRVNIAVDDLQHTQTVDGVTLVVGEAVAVDDLGHSHTLGAVTLEQRHVLQVQDLAHAHGLDAVNFSLANGVVSVTFSVAMPGVEYSSSRPEVAITSSRPEVELEGEG